MEEQRHNPDNESIIKILRDALEISISPQDSSGLLPLIEQRFEYHKILKEYGPGRPVLEVIDDALIALQKVAPCYLLILEIDWEGIANRFREKGLEFDLEEIDFVDPTETKEAERKGKKLYDLYKDLFKVRKKAQEIFDDLHPVVNLQIVDAEGWLSWSLWNLIRSTFTDRAIRKKQIDYAVYRLRGLWGVEERESRDPANMVRMRIRRFENKLAPLVQEELRRRNSSST